MKIKVNYSKRDIEIPKKIATKLGRNLKIAIIQNSEVIKNEIKKEMRKPKTGALKPKNKYKASPLRRSAPGESLARDTGASEKLIASNMINSTSGVVGFLNNPKGFNYIAYWNNKNDTTKRPTMEFSIKSSLFKQYQNLRNLMKINNFK